MLKKPIFKEMFALLAIVGLLNFLAVRYHLYWSVYEFDSLVHFLGGTVASAFFLWFYFYSGFFRPTKWRLRNFLSIAILGGMCIALAWEIFELFLGEAAMNKIDYGYDTTMDLLMDFLGILTFGLYAYLQKPNTETAGSVPTGENKQISSLSNNFKKDFFDQNNV